MVCICQILFGNTDYRREKNHRLRKILFLLVLKHVDVDISWPSSPHASFCSPIVFRCAESPRYRILIERGLMLNWIEVRKGQPFQPLEPCKLQIKIGLDSDRGGAIFLNFRGLFENHQKNIVSSIEWTESVLSGFFCHSDFMWNQMWYF